MMDGLMDGILGSTYEDECVDARNDLDARRKEHETRHRRFRLELRPATRAEMIEYIKAVGVTDLVHDARFIHVPVKAVTGGVAFAPERMTIGNLTDVYLHLKSGRQMDRTDLRVYDRVEEVFQTYTSGLRKQDVVALADAPERTVRRVLEKLEAEGKLRVRLERTRGAGSKRKRYYPAAQPKMVSADLQIAVGNL